MKQTDDDYRDLQLLLAQKKKEIEEGRKDPSNAYLIKLYYD
jgi:hypothetical protein